MSIHFTLPPIALRGRSGQLGLCLSLALFAGCASTGADAPKAVPPVASAGAKVVNVSEANAGAVITLERDQLLIVSLLMDVSAGVDWSLVDMTSSLLTVQSLRFDRTFRDSFLGDLGGQMVWTLKPTAPGDVTLNFDLRKPHSLMPAVRSISFQVHVK
jgi:predicted secreted protein